MGLNSEASAALVYLILYTLLFVLLLFGYLSGRLSLYSRYSIILFHVTIRLASQSTGLAVGIVGLGNYHILVAYFVLSAEGYFTLMLCAYRFVISWQYDNSKSHNSWLEPKSPPNTPRFKKILDSFSPFGSRGEAHPMAIIHHLLIVANALIVAGGSIVAGADLEALNKNMPTSKGLRATGQAVFLMINIFLLFCIFNVIQQSKRDYPEKRIHPTLLILLVTWPLLFIRGLYGLLSAVVPTFNYFDPTNYGDTGLKPSFVISEYVLSTTMEWASCTLLTATYITSRNDPEEAMTGKFDSKEVGWEEGREA